MARYRFKTIGLYHYTLEKGVYISVYLQYNLKSKGVGIYQILRFDGKQLGLRNLGNHLGLGRRRSYALNSGGVF